jgi:hypothetical protein
MSPYKWTKRLEEKRLNSYKAAKAANLFGLVHTRPYTPKKAKGKGS